MSPAQTVVTDALSSTSVLASGSNKPNRVRKGKQYKAGADRATTNRSQQTEQGEKARDGKPLNKPSRRSANRQRSAMACSTQAASPIALWPAWPAACIDRDGMVHTTNAKVLTTLKPVLLQKAGQPLQLTASANRRLWNLVTPNQTKEQWKVLDPVFWPFIGIVGWSEQSSDMLQLAVWESAQTSWEIDDSWRQILAATAAVKAKRRRRVA